MNIKKQKFWLLIQIYYYQIQNMIKILSSINNNISFKNNALSRNALKLRFNFSKNYQQVARNYMQPIRTKFQIIDKQKLNHDCYIFKFKFDGPKFPLKIGHHFRIIANIPTNQNPQGQEIMKYYTPITSCQDFQNDKIHVLIKIYRPNQDPLYPKGGKLTPYLQTLNVGDKLNIQGPFGKFTYISPGKVQICNNLFSKTKKIYHASKLFFIAGGTGITPIYQTLTQISKIPQDKTQMTLLFCNKAQKDIILRKQLEALQPRLNLNLMLQKIPNQWTGLQGRPNIDVLNKVFPLNDPTAFYLYCGPKAMNMAITKIFEQNHPTSNFYKI